MHYIKIEPPQPVLQPVTGQPTPDGQTNDFPSIVRLACQGILQKQALSALEVFDLEDKLTGAKVGEYVALTEPEYQAIRPLFEKPSAWPPAVTMSIRAFIRAVVKAPEERPVHVDTTNGVPARA